jgi:hypothetical protein
VVAETIKERKFINMMKRKFDDETMSKKRQKFDISRKRKFDGEDDSSKRIKLFSEIEEKNRRITQLEGVLQAYVHRVQELEYLLSLERMRTYNHTSKNIIESY